MRNIAAIIGRPGTGKSSLVREVMRQLALDWRLTKPVPLLSMHVSEMAHTAVLGDYSDESHTFPGTDRLSMAAAPAAVEWLRDPFPFSVRAVLFEGDRLGNASTLRLLSLMPDVRLRVWCLTASEYELQHRYMRRGSAQSAQVLQARATKVANICCNPNLNVRVRENRDITQQQANVAEILQFLLMGFAP